ncbi:unnamed protein product [Ixodes pacificus]
MPLLQASLGTCITAPKGMQESSEPYWWHGLPPMRARVLALPMHLGFSALPSTRGLHFLVPVLVAATTMLGVGSGTKLIEADCIEFRTSWKVCGHSFTNNTVFTKVHS